MQLKTYLSAKQVVERLNGAISVKHVYRLVAQGKLRANRKLGKVLIELESLIELLEGKPPPSRPTPKVKGTKPAVDLW